MKKKYLLALLLFSLLISCGNSDNSNLLCDGKDYCFIFTSITTNDGDVDTTNDGNPITEADAICNADSNKTNTATYKALFVDGSNRQACSESNCANTEEGRIDWPLRASMEYRQTDGTTIIATTSIHGVFTFDITNVFSSATDNSWTGLNDNFVTHTVDCSNFNSNSGGASGAMGMHNDKTEDSIYGGDDTCSDLNRFICIEQP